MRFQVPQFIEVEDKIFGPLTFMQFAYLAGGVGFLIAMLVVLPTWAAILIGSPFAILGLALAFYRVNDRPFISVLQSALEYLTKHKLYVWEKKPPAATKNVPVAEALEQDDPSKYVPAATASKIKDLAWSLDIKDSIYSDRKQK